DGGHPAVEVPAEADLLAARLGVHVDEDVIDLAKLADRGLDLGEGGPARLHVEVAREVDDPEPDPRRALHHAGPMPWLAAQVVGRPQDARLLVEVGVDLAAMIGVVAKRDDVDSGREEAARDLRRDPKAA